MATYANIKIILRKSKRVLFFESLNSALEFMHNPGKEDFFIRICDCKDNYLINGYKIVEYPNPPLKIAINGDEDKKIEILEEILEEKIEIENITNRGKGYFGLFDGTSEDLEEEEEEEA